MSVVGFLCTGLASVLLSMVRLRHNLAIPLGFGTSMKLLNHSDVSSTPDNILFSSAISHLKVL